MPNQQVSEYVLVKRSVLPKNILKTLETKEMLKNRGARTLQDALEELELHNSVYYRHKNSVFSFYIEDFSNILALLISFENIKGVLPRILKIISLNFSNVISIEQGIPINNVVNLKLTFESSAMKKSLENIVQEFGKMKNVHCVDIICNKPKLDLMSRPIKNNK